MSEYLSRVITSDKVGSSVDISFDGTTYFVANKSGTGSFSVFKTDNGPTTYSNNFTQNKQTIKFNDSDLLRYTNEELTEFILGNTDKELDICGSKSIVIGNELLVTKIVVASEGIPIYTILDDDLEYGLSKIIVTFSVDRYTRVDEENDWVYNSTCYLGNHITTFIGKSFLYHNTVQIPKFTKINDTTVLLETGLLDLESGDISGASAEPTTKYVYILQKSGDIWSVLQTITNETILAISQERVSCVDIDISDESIAIYSLELSNVFNPIKVSIYEKINTQWSLTGTYFTRIPTTKVPEGLFGILTNNFRSNDDIRYDLYKLTSPSVFMNLSIQKRGNTLILYDAFYGSTGRVYVKQIPGSGQGSTLIDIQEFNGGSSGGTELESLTYDTSNISVSQTPFVFGSNYANNTLGETGQYFKSRLMGMSSDGRRIVKGDYYSGNFSSSGSITIAEYENGTWTDIFVLYGQAANDRIDLGARISGNGLRLFVRGSATQTIRVFDFDPITKTFIETSSLISAYSWYLVSETGNRLIISPSIDLCRIYDYNFVDSSWDLITTETVAPSDAQFRTLSISRDGTYITFGYAPISGGYFTNEYHVKVWKETSGVWGQHGQTVVLASYYGWNAPKMSSDGTRFFVHNISNNGGNTYSCIKIYEYDSQQNLWINTHTTENLVSTPLLKLRVSDDLDRILLVAQDSVDPYAYYIQIYDYVNSTWQQYGNNIIPGGNGRPLYDIAGSTPALFATPNIDRFAFRGYGSSEYIQTYELQTTSDPIFETKNITLSTDNKVTLVSDSTYDGNTGCISFVTNDYSTNPDIVTIKGNVGDEFGYSLSEPLAIDLYYDGIENQLPLYNEPHYFLVGSPGFSGSTGRVYTLKKDVSTNTVAHVLPEMTGENIGDRFGASVLDISTDLVAIGAPGYDNGRGYVIIKSRRTSQEIKIMGENVGDLTGTSITILRRSVATRGNFNMFAIGEPGYDNGRGRVRFFSMYGYYQILSSDGGWTPLTISEVDSITGGTQGEMFGYSVVSARNDSVCDWSNGTGYYGVDTSFAISSIGFDSYRGKVSLFKNINDIHTTLTGSKQGEYFGTTIKFLTPDCVSIGSPNADDPVNGYTNCGKIITYTLPLSANTNSIVAYGSANDTNLGRCIATHMYDVNLVFTSSGNQLTTFKNINGIPRSYKDVFAPTTLTFPYPHHMIKTSDGIIICTGRTYNALSKYSLQSLNGTDVLKLDHTLNHIDILESGYDTGFARDTERLFALEQIVYLENTENIYPSFSLDPVVHTVVVRDDIAFFRYNFYKNGVSTSKLVGCKLDFVQPENTKIIYSYVDNELEGLGYDITIEDNTHQAIFTTDPIATFHRKVQKTYNQYTPTRMEIYSRLRDPFFTYNGTIPDGELGTSLGSTWNGDRIVVGSPGSSRVLIFTFIESTQQYDIKTIVSPDATTGNSFGYSVAIAKDDGNTIVIGAPGINVVYVYQIGLDGQWYKTYEHTDTEVYQKIKYSQSVYFDMVPNPQPYIPLDDRDISKNRYGHSVDITPDGRYITAGAPGTTIRFIHNDNCKFIPFTFQDEDISQGIPPKPHTYIDVGTKENGFSRYGLFGTNNFYKNVSTLGWVRVLHSPDGDWSSSNTTTVGQIIHGDTEQTFLSYSYPEYEYHVKENQSFDFTASGTCVKITPDGKKVVVGSPRYSVSGTENNVNIGKIETYEFDAINNYWLKNNQKITGLYGGARVGGTFSLDFQGERMAIISKRTPREYTNSENIETGYIQIYDFSKDKWFEDDTIIRSLDGFMDDRECHINLVNGKDIIFTSKEFGNDLNGKLKVYTKQLTQSIEGNSIVGGTLISKSMFLGSNDGVKTTNDDTKKLSFGGTFGTDNTYESSFIQNRTYYNDQTSNAYSELLLCKKRKNIFGDFDGIDQIRIKAPEFHIDKDINEDHTVQDPALTISTDGLIKINPEMKQPNDYGSANIKATLDVNGDIYSRDKIVISDYEANSTQGIEKIPFRIQIDRSKRENRFFPKTFTKYGYLTIDVDYFTKAFSLSTIEHVESSVYVNSLYSDISNVYTTYSYPAANDPEVASITTDLNGIDQNISFNIHCSTIFPMVSGSIDSTLIYSGTKRFDTNLPNTDVTHTDGTLTIKMSAWYFPENATPKHVILGRIASLGSSFLIADDAALNTKLRVVVVIHYDQDIQDIYGVSPQTNGSLPISIDIYDENNKHVWYAIGFCNLDFFVMTWHHVYVELNSSYHPDDQILAIDNIKIPIVKTSRKTPTNAPNTEITHVNSHTFLSGSLGSKHGTNVKISVDGKWMIVGEPNLTTSNGTFSGQVRVFNLVRDTWIQVGDSIKGGSANQRLGTAIDISNEIDTFFNKKYPRIVIGYENARGYGSGGEARLCTWVPTGEGGEWTHTVRRGSNFDKLIYSEVANEQFGKNVSISLDGRFVAVASLNGINIYEVNSQYDLFFVQTYTTGTGYEYKCKFSGNSEFLLVSHPTSTGSQDVTLLKWNGSTYVDAQPISPITHSLLQRIVTYTELRTSATSITYDGSMIVRRRGFDVYLSTRTDKYNWSDQLILTLPLPPQYNQYSQPFKYDNCCTQISDDGSIIVTGDPTQYIVFIITKDPSNQWVVSQGITDLQSRTIFAKHTALSPDGTVLLITVTDPNTNLVGIIVYSKDPQGTWIHQYEINTTTPDSSVLGYPGFHLYAQRLLHVSADNNFFIFRELDYITIFSKDLQGTFVEEYRSPVPGYTASGINADGTVAATGNLLRDNTNGDARVVCDILTNDPTLGWSVTQQIEHPFASKADSDKQILIGLSNIIFSRDGYTLILEGVHSISGTYQFYWFIYTLINGIWCLKTAKRRTTGYVTNFTPSNNLSRGHGESGFLSGDGTIFVESEPSSNSIGSEDSVNSYEIYEYESPLYDSNVNTITINTDKSDPSAFIIGAPTSSGGNVYVYSNIYNDNVWGLETETFATLGIEREYGHAVAISDSHDRSYAVTSYDAGSPASQVYVYVQNNDDAWEKTPTLTELNTIYNNGTSQQISSNTMFGSDLSYSYGGRYLAIGIPNSSVSGPEAGEVRVLRKEYSNVKTWVGGMFVYHPNCDKVEIETIKADTGITWSDDQNQNILPIEHPTYSDFYNSGTPFDKLIVDGDANIKRGRLKLGNHVIYSNSNALEISKPVGVTAVVFNSVRIDPTLREISMFDVYNSIVRYMYLNTGSLVYADIVAPSDDRLKDNEEYIQNATDTILKLKPQIYDKRTTLDAGENTTTKRESGLIAQDVYYDAPELRHVVTIGEGGNPPETKPYMNDDPTQDPDYSSWGPKHAGVSYTQIIPYLIKSNQEIYQELQTEKEKNIVLTSKIEAMEQTIQSMLDRISALE